MEFDFNINEILPGHITVVESQDSNSILRVYDLKSLENSNKGIDDSWTCNVSSNIIWDAKLRKRKENLESIIDKMGLASAKAQSLHSPITTFKKLLNSNQQKIYIIKDLENPHSITGILKIGIKRLFMCDDIGAHHETEAMCILDFYVHESKQRCGFGHELFNVMLRVEKIDPSKLAIDKPSFKFLAFLNKHYSLRDPKTQANNFVVYSGFFQDRAVTRPPIFLYNKQDTQMPNSCAMKQMSHQENSSITDSVNALDAHPFPSLSESMKSKTFYSSTGNCHRREDRNSTLDDYYKKKISHFSSNEMHSSCFDEKNWGVYDAMHSYSGDNTSLNDCNKQQSTNQCSLTPVDNANMCSQEKWNQLQSSWNIFGVKPPDYAMVQKRS